VPNPKIDRSFSQPATPGIARLSAVTASIGQAGFILNKKRGDIQMQKMLSKTAKDYANDLAERLSDGKPFVKEDNGDNYGQFCCLAKWGGVYTVAYYGDGDIIIEISILDGWNTIWQGRWDTEIDMETFIERIWDGDTGDQLTEKKDEEDLTDEESENDMDNDMPLE
jgi:hypothetical protein